MSRQIVWAELDKSKYYFYGCTVFLGIRVIVYPANLVKTRLQVQKGSSVYRGSYDAYYKVYKAEGLRGFYRGFHVFAWGVLFGQAYITTYEYTKHHCSHLNPFLQGLIPGAVASVAGQTLSVPADVITQRLQIQGMAKPKDLTSVQHNVSEKSIGLGTIKKRSVFDVCRKIVKYDGVSGFYRGFMISLMCQVPTSAVWWASYNSLLETVGLYAEPDRSGRHPMHVQGICGILSGASSAVFTNPLDVIRTRIQVGGSRSVRSVTEKLWREEGIKMLYKGLSARITAMSSNSCLIILGYETVKRLSVKTT